MFLDPARQGCKLKAQLIRGGIQNLLKPFAVLLKLSDVDDIVLLHLRYLDKSQCRNGKGVGIFNGDTGIIREINTFVSFMTIEFDGGRIVNYPFSVQEELELAYAITIHKSQGSEYPAVLIPLLGGPRPLMTRNLLYTAVTRAKNCLVILGDEETVREMIENRQTRQRYTSLDSRILEMKALLCGE